MIRFILILKCVDYLDFLNNKLDFDFILYNFPHFGLLFCACLLRPGGVQFGHQEPLELDQQLHAGVAAAAATRCRRIRLAAQNFVTNDK